MFEDFLVDVAVSVVLAVVFVGMATFVHEGVMFLMGKF